MLKKPLLAAQVLSSQQPAGCKGSLGDNQPAQEYLRSGFKFISWIQCCPLLSWNQFGSLASSSYHQMPGAPLYFSNASSCNELLRWHYISPQSPQNSLSQGFLCQRVATATAPSDGQQVPSKFSLKEFSFRSSMKHSEKAGLWNQRDLSLNPGFASYMLYNLGLSSLSLIIEHWKTRIIIHDSKDLES